MARMMVYLVDLCEHAPPGKKKWDNVINSFTRTCVNEESEISKERGTVLSKCKGN